MFIKKRIFIIIFVLTYNFMFSQQVEPYSISDKINTTGNEYVPTLSADGKTLYFCGSDRDDNIGGEDIYISHFENGEWTQAELFTELSDNTDNESVLTISIDGNSLILFINGMIYSSEKTNTGWSEPKIFDELNYADWNSDACFTSDGNAILFASGSTYFSLNIDIYVIEKNADGTWSKPINLGTTINAGDYNRSPYLHSDMKTLYFSTNGYNGEGELDIYKTDRLNENSWTEWSEPVNLGSNINKDGYDWGFKLNTQGDRAIYNVVVGDQHDIYMFDLVEEIQPEKTVTVTGVITDKNNNALDVEIIWEDLETGEKKGSLRSNPNNGEYIIILPLDKNYGFYVSKEGYYPESDNIDLRSDVTNYNIKKDFVLLDVEQVLEGESIQLKNLFFETAKFNLKKESFPELNRLADFIQNNPTIKIEISGHTDNAGSDNYNKNLSNQRANEVMKYLINKGCDIKQMTAVGYGEEKPIATNDTDKGKAQNRRVEFKVLEN